MVASTRPPGTTPADLQRMVDDVLTKLDLRPELSVCEIGCGTGVLAVPVAQRVARLVGVDFARRGPGRARPAAWTRPACADRAVLLATRRAGPRLPGQLARLGPFDRVLVYATFHYVRDTDHADRFLQRVVELLRPDGIALIGNLPVVELADQLRRAAHRIDAAPGAGPGRWLGREDTPVTPELGLEGPGPGHHVAGQRRRPAADEAGKAPGPTAAMATGPALAAGTVMPLRIDLIEALLRGLDRPTTHRWVAPGIGVPMYLDRADLLVTRSTAPVTGGGPDR